MQIAVVIPALDEVDRIQDAIESARAPDVEIVVVDGGSRDGTPEKARAGGARVVESVRGRARQLAAGAAATSAEALLFLHADTRLPAGWAPAVAGALADPRVAGGAFGFRFEREEEGRGPGPWLRFVEWGVGVRLALARLPYGDQALFVRRAALDAMGGVPQAPIMEDLDLVRGIRAAGRLAILPLAVRTSARRYRARGPARIGFRNAVALVAWYLGIDRERVASWYHR